MGLPPVAKNPLEQSLRSFQKEKASVSNATRTIFNRAGARIACRGSRPKGTVLYKKLVRVILASPCYVIATLRTKTDYVMEPDENGRNRVRKVGLKPIQREGIDYEFDLGFSMDMTNTATVTKTHSRLFPNGMEIPQPGKETAERILQWLSQAPEQPKIIPPIEIQNTETQPDVESAPTENKHQRRCYPGGNQFYAGSHQRPSENRCHLERAVPQVEN